MTDEPKAGSAPVEKACCEECKRFHRHFRTDCCKCRTSFGPTDIPEAPVDKAGETVIDAKTGIFWRFEGADHPDVTCSGKEAFCSFCELATKGIALRAELATEREIRSSFEQSSRNLEAYACQPTEERRRLPMARHDILTRNQIEKFAAELAQAREEIAKLREGNQALARISNAVDGDAQVWREELAAEKAAREKSELENADLKRRIEVLESGHGRGANPEPQP